MMEPVGVALVGYGYWGANLARNLASASTTNLVGIVDQSEEQRGRASREHPSASVWARLEDALRFPEVEAVVVATPAAAHADVALRAIEVGRHVLVEKPLATTVADATRVAEAADAAGTVAMVGHTFLYSAPVLRLRELIEQGDLGAVQYLYSQRLSLGRIRRDCNAAWNFAPHDISIMCFLLDRRPVEVSARGFSFIEAGIEDVSFVSIEFEGGVGANLHVSWIDPRKTRLTTVVGDEKMAIYNDVSVDQKLWIVDAGVARSPDFGGFESMGEFQWRTRAGDILIPKIDMREPLLVEMEEFGRACRTGQPATTDAWHGVEVVRVLAAIDESMAGHGAPVELR